MRSFEQNDEGFTGLEAAIVLIAFVVVAAVFSYVVLGAGFFTTQKAQETVHTGVAQATSAVELSGPVMVQANTDSNSVKNITFYLQLAAGGNAVDITKIGYTVSTPAMMKTVQGTDSNVVNITWLKIIQTGNLLEPREMVLIDLGTEGMGFDSTSMKVNDKVTVEVKPPIGSSLPITRTLPAALNTPNWYEVY
ncbi:archaellin/type IV pilin N-terminal domain-containing protein [Methanoregula formicica]|uniref:Flagellin n=1 Tax=Methanoregula formicica (strain DSM 22288 / NBRC 105244 / SMSP) TaxID=593750 RepID=L0HET7_METFS|nr:archaellin/type IV pilin N-terminal domain-containing protein [Methanoregula formicica]AGB02540.1 archaeal flagellin-like protein [Methanoregula formicica SMSP]